MARDAIELGRKQQTRVFEARGHLSLGFALCQDPENLDASALEELQEATSQAETIMEQTGAASLSFFILELQSRLARYRGDRKEAARLLDEAVVASQRTGATGHHMRLLRVRDR